MPKNNTATLTDDDLDPIELADKDDDTATGDDDAVILPPEEDGHPLDPDADIVEAIAKIEVPEESAAKQKAHMIPHHLINAPLRPEDLWDEGTI